MRLHRTAASPTTDDGFTLVELMVSLTVLSVGILSVAGVMHSSFRVAGAARSRAKAVAVATQQIESLRAVPYAQLLVSNTVTESDVVVGGGRYHVRRAVRWADEATVADAYKEATVAVSWTDEAGFHEVHQATVIYPGGLGPEGGIDSVMPMGGTPLPPTVVLALPVAGTTGVDLSWTPPLLSPSAPVPASYVVQYSTGSSFTAYEEVSDPIPANTPFVRVDNLAAGTTYHFRVASRAANGNLSASFAYAWNVQTGAALSTDCEVGAATVTPAAVKKKSGSDGSGLAVNPVVTISVTGACSGTSFQMRYSARADGTYQAVTLGGSLTRTGQVVGTSQAWTIGDHDIEVFDGAGGLRASIRLVVCDHQKQVCP